MPKHTLRCIVAALSLVMFVLTAAPALAASTDWKSIDVTLQTGDKGQSELVVSGTLPSDVGLPAEAELAVPSGTEMRWIGEILGGPVSEDPSLQYTKSVVNGMDVYKFTLTKSRIAQFEGNAQGATVVSGPTRSTSLKWTAWRTLAEVHLRERLPQGAQVTQPAEGAAVESGDAGSTFYSKTVKSPKAGELLDLTFAYTAPAAAPAPSLGATGGSDSNSTAITIILALVATGFGMLVMGLWQKMSRKPEAVAETRTTKTAKAAPKAVVATKQPGAQTTAAKTAPKAAVATSQPDIRTPRAKAPLGPRLAIVAVCVVLAIAVVTAVSLATATPVVNGKVTKFFGASSACQNVSIPVVANEGVDLTSQAARLIDAFTGQDGVGDVTLDIERAVLEVGFCESSQSEDSVRKIIADTGLVSLGTATAAGAPASDSAATAKVEPSGKLQTASIDTASGDFSPAVLVLKAGIPAEIEFGQGSGTCMAEVVFADLNIRESIAGGPVKIKLPALEPGNYAFACGMDMQRGTLVVK